MKNSIEYSIVIQKRSKESLIKECLVQLEKLNKKFGKDIGATKERAKIHKRIQDIEGFCTDNI